MSTDHIELLTTMVIGCGRGTIVGMLRGLRTFLRNMVYFNLKNLNDPRYQSELSFLSMTIDSIVGRPGNIDKFNRDQFAYGDIREAFDLFVKEVKSVDSADIPAFVMVLTNLVLINSEPAWLAVRSLGWALDNRK